MSIWRRLEPNEHDTRTWVRPCGPFALSVGPLGDYFEAYAWLNEHKISFGRFHATEARAKRAASRRARHWLEWMSRDLG